MTGAASFRTCDAHRLDGMVPLGQPVEADIDLSQLPDVGAWLEERRRIQRYRNAASNWPGPFTAEEWDELSGAHDKEVRADGEGGRADG